MAANNSFVVRYQIDNNVQPIAPHIQRGTAHYEGGEVTPCLIHIFDGANVAEVNSALQWVSRANASSLFLKVLGVHDRRNANNPPFIVLTESIVSTFGVWVANLASPIQHIYGGTHVSPELAEKLRLLFTTMADLGVNQHGAINSANIFLVRDGNLKLGRTNDNPPSTDIQQLNVMVRGFAGLNPFPGDLDYLLGSLINGQCWTRHRPDWIANNLRFAALSPALMCAREDLQNRESTHYKIEELAAQANLSKMVRKELHARLVNRYPGIVLRNGITLIDDWKGRLSLLQPSDWRYPLKLALSQSFYNPQDPFAFCKYGRHVKVHKPPGWSDEAVFDGCNYILDGFSSIVHEVLSGFGISVNG